MYSMDVGIAKIKQMFERILNRENTHFQTGIAEYSGRQTAFKNTYKFGTRC